MTQTKEQIAIIEALTVLAIALGENVEKERFRIYAKILAPYAVPDITAAIGRAMETCKFFPKPAEIIELIKAARRADEKDPALAWEELLDAIELHGYTSDVQFDDGAIAAAVLLLGGWEYLCGLSDEEMIYQRLPARFQAAYREAVKAGRHKAPGIVRGCFTRENRMKGLDKDFPLLVKRARTTAEIMAGSRPRPPLPQLGQEVKALEFKPREISGELTDQIEALAERMAL